MKAILVVDMPEACADGCPVMCRARGINHRPSWCPLRPLPQKKEETFAYWLVRGCNDAESYINGWNDCIDEIMGETE